MDAKTLADRLEEYPSLQESGALLQPSFTRSELRMVIAALREYVPSEDSDNERLNWLQQHRCTVYNSLEGRHWVVVDETKKERRGDLGKDLRAAIDAARGISGGE